MELDARQYSPASQRNRAPILAQLQTYFANSQNVLEIGSGSGEHAIYFAPALPHLHWQTSDLAENHPSILAWQMQQPSPNLGQPWALDMQEVDWPSRCTKPIDAIFSANTCHIMSWQQVQHFVAGAGNLLPAGGILAIYGPFNDAGQFTSASNAAFDTSLRQRAVHMGLRDKQAMHELAAQAQLQPLAEVGMPANNLLLAWRKIPL